MENIVFLMFFSKSLDSLDTQYFVYSHDVMWFSSLVSWQLFCLTVCSEWTQTTWWKTFAILSYFYRTAAPECQAWRRAAVSVILELFDDSNSGNEHLCNVPEATDDEEFVQVPFMNQIIQKQSWSLRSTKLADTTWALNATKSRHHLSSSHKFKLISKPYIHAVTTTAWNLLL